MMKMMTNLNGVGGMPSDEDDDGRDEQHYHQQQDGQRGLGVRAGHFGVHEAPGAGKF